MALCRTILHANMKRCIQKMPDILWELWGRLSFCHKKRPAKALRLWQSVNTVQNRARCQKRLMLISFCFFLSRFADVNVPRPDERSIMTYVSSMYQMLNKRRNKNKNANRVGKVGFIILCPLSWPKKEIITFQCTCKRLKQEETDKGWLHLVKA